MTLLRCSSCSYEWLENRSIEGNVSCPKCSKQLGNIQDFTKQQEQSISSKALQPQSPGNIQNPGNIQQNTLSQEHLQRRLLNRKLKELQDVLYFTGVNRYK